MLRDLWQKARQAKARLNHKVHHMAHTGEHATHYMYLRFVYFESNGLYGKAAAVMLVFLAVADVFNAD